MTFILKVKMSFAVRLWLIGAVILSGILLPTRPVFSQHVEPSTLAAPAGLEDVVSCNKEEVKRSKRDGWTAEFGKEIAELDYTEFVVAIYALVEEGDEDRLVKFFEKRVDDIADTISKATKQLGKRAIAELIVAAILKGESQNILAGDLEVNAGIARLDCRVEFKFKALGRTYQLGWFDWLPHYLPYIRYRVNLNLPQLDFGEVGEMVGRIEQELATLKELERKLREEFAQSEAEIKARLKQEVRELIVQEIAAQIDKHIPALPAHNYMPLLRTIVDRALNSNGFAQISIEQIRQNLGGLLDNIVKEVIVEFNRNVAKVLSTHPGSLVTDWATSNRSDVRDKILGDGEWFVVWGVTMDDQEYSKFTAAVIGSYFTGGASLATYFKAYLDKTLALIERQKPEIERHVMEDILIKTLKETAKENGDLSKVLRTKTLDIQAGIAIYDRWVNFKYPKISAHWKKKRLAKLGVYNVTIEYIDKIEFNGWAEEKIDFLPNHHQPYFKFRYTDGKFLSPIVNDPDAGGIYFGCDNESSKVQETYVDSNAQGVGDGTQARPFGSVTAGANCIQDNGTVWIAKGTYDESLRISHPVTLRSTGGTVSIKSTYALTPVSTEPKLLFSTAGLHANATAGSSNPKAISLTIGRSGSGVLTWTASTSQPWLSVTPTSGAAPATIDVSINGSRLQEGTHKGEITVRAGAETVKRSVTLNVAAKAAAAVLQATPNMLSYRGTEGGDPPDGQTIAVANSGGGDLSWTATASESWLELSLTSGTAPSTIMVFVDSGDLAEGVYNGQVRINAGDQSETVAVSFRLNAAGNRSLYLPLITR